VIYRTNFKLNYKKQWLMSKKGKVLAPMCVCGRGRKVDDCCMAIIEGRRKALSAAELMRSRYTAFKTVNRHYILQSWHSSTRPRDIEFDENTDWLGLKLISVSKVTNECTEKTAFVEFIADYRCNGVMGQMHERSRFLSDEGIWFYVDGEQIEPGSGASIKRPGRNDPCFCGSGKKFKKCCAGVSAQ